MTPWFAKDKMFYFQTQQKVFEIGDWKIGGQPGEYPTVLFGGIREITEKNQEEVKKQLERQTQLSKKFNIPASVDLFIRKKKHLSKIEFIANQISEPFLLDLPFTPEKNSEEILELKRAVLEYVARENLQDRVIYNSINFATSDEEIEMLKNYGIKSAILLSTDVVNPGTKDSLALLENHLISYAERAGIKNFLVDPGTLPFDNENVAGEVFRSIMAIKSETGFPAGCGTINLAESWDYFRERKEHSEYARAISTINAVAQVVGADFLIYGPLSLAEDVFICSTIVDKISKEANTRYFGLESKIVG